MRSAYFLLIVGCSGTRTPPPPPPAPSASIVAVKDPPPAPPPSISVEPVDSGAPPAPTTSATDVGDLFGPSPIAVTAETKCNVDNDCVISHRCCSDEVTNRLHAPGNEKDCGIKKCPAMVSPPIVDKKCCAHACTPIFKKGQTCSAG